MVCVHQRLDSERLADPRGTARAATEELLAQATTAPGQSVALTGSSRGIAHIADIIAGAVEALRAAGLEPFVVPAMGSHAGGTAESQRAVLHHYGVHPERIGAPVHSSTDVVEIANTPLGIPIVMDKLAAGADHILAINRVKAHSHFAGPIESGIAKILLIGLGKPAGAKVYHRGFARHGFYAFIECALPVLLRHVSVLGGLAIVENGLDDTARIEALAAADILAREPALLLDAHRRMPRLPIDDLDVLIVDRMGKDISGVGMDPNVIGRDRPGPHIQVILVRDLTPASEGNAAGIGLADVTVQRLIDKMDPKATFLNCATALHTHLARVPYAFGTDREALEAALGATAAPSPDQTRVAWIRDTHALADLEVSEALLADVAASDHLEATGQPHDILFHPDGSLADVFAPHGQ